LNITPSPIQTRKRARGKSSTTCSTPPKRARAENGQASVSIYFRKTYTQKIIFAKNQKKKRKAFFDFPAKILVPILTKIF